MDMITLALAKKYTDEKAGYAEPGKTLLETELVDEGGVGTAVVLGHIGLEVGKKYTVTVDSGTYEFVGFDGSFAGLGVIVGNEETVCVMEFVDNGVAGTMVQDMTNGKHCTVATAETVHPIDPKYLPGVCLPVVEITSAPTEDGAALTAEEKAIVEAAMAQNAPIVVRFTESDVMNAYVFDLGGESGVRLYTKQLGGFQYIIGDMGAGMSAYMVES